VVCLCSHLNLAKEAQILWYRRGEEEMDYDPEKAIAYFKRELQKRSGTLPTEFEILETRLKLNRQDARRHGDDSSKRSEFFGILDSFIQMSKQLTGKELMDWAKSSPTEDFFAPPESRPDREAALAPSVSITTTSEPAYLGKKRCWAVLVGVGKYDESGY